ncbi:flavodoxin [Chloroflexus islandicus]|uniref:Flavodoxin n=1 Tax=Chloroflexus islandicus TaxID=1707952 RepID=A0A178LSF5_9CHLR|nr:flavodoxin [Chloroflexus islandicus]OAN36333.1 flavodoxin [Chloroflexus islandicus]
MIVVVYGSSTNNTKDAATLIAETLRSKTTLPVDLIDVAILKRDLRPLLAYWVWIIGCPTWNIGELQDDWYDAFPQFDQLDLHGTIVALFGFGDQQGYPDTFQDALGLIGRKVRERGATIIGRWPTAGYDFYHSLGVEDGMFFGLALDYENEDDKTTDRIQTWVNQLLDELVPRFEQAPSGGAIAG